MSQYLNPTPPPIPGGQAPQMLPSQQKKSGCLKYILIAVGVLVFFGIIQIIVSNSNSDATGKAVDPEVTLVQAEANIVSASDGLAYSNSDAGHKMASEFSRLFKAAAIEGTDTIKESDKFIVHCQQNADSNLFIVHVPKLRKFEKESKERFCEIAWVIAHQVLAQGGAKPGSKLAVGVKGIARYQNIYFGNFDFANLLEESKGIERKGTVTSALEDYFGVATTEPTKP